MLGVLGASVVDGVVGVVTFTGGTRGGREGALGVSDGGRLVGVALLERELWPVGDRLK